MRHPDTPFDPASSSAAIARDRSRLSAAATETLRRTERNLLMAGIALAVSGAVLVVHASSKSMFAHFTTVHYTVAMYQVAVVGFAAVWCGVGVAWIANHLWSVSRRHDVDSALLTHRRHWRIAVVAGVCGAVFAAGNVYPFFRAEYVRLHPHHCFVVDDNDATLANMGLSLRFTPPPPQDDEAASRSVDPCTAWKRAGSP